MSRVPPVPALVPPNATFKFGESPFHAKGVLYIGTQSFFEANLQGGFARFLESIEQPELRAFISKRFLAGSWYDVMPVPALIAVEARALGMPLDSYLLHRTRWQATRDLSGVYGWVLKVATPGAVAARLPRIFAQMFDFAVIGEQQVEHEHTTAFLGGIPDPLVPWLTSGISVYADTAVKLAGARKVEVAVASEPERAQSGLALRRMRIEVAWK